MVAATCLKGIDPAAYRPHPLHGSQRNWPETNCYVDLWIELLSAMGLQPEAALGFTVAQDFEGDQFTFFKFPLEDLAALYDLSVQELAIYDRVEAHALEQLSRGRLVLVEVDSFYLPDTLGTSYRATHGKTTIAINHLDPESKRLHYFHNAGYFALSAEDFDGIFRPKTDAGISALFPYVEFVKRGKPRPAGEMVGVVLELLRKHLSHRPASNPVRAYQLAFPGHAVLLTQRSMEYFHLYAFNTLRQLGANFELLGSHLSWLGLQGEAGLEESVNASNELAGSAKTLQFQLARAVSRKRFDSFVGLLEPVAVGYEQLMATLAARYGC